MLFGDYKLIAREMAIAYTLIKDGYGDVFNEQKCQFAAGIVQCLGVIHQDPYYSPSYFEAAFGRANLGQCGLDVFCPEEIYKTPWYDVPSLSFLEIFCNYVMNIECVLIAKKTATPMLKSNRIVKGIIRRRKAIKRQVKKIVFSNTLFDENKSVQTRYQSLMHLDEFDDWKSFIFFDFKSRC